MSILTKITHQDVLEAISAYEAGIEHPYGNATRYELLHQGNSYPPKAIAGIAARRTHGSMPSGEHEISSGTGAGQAVKVLRDLGFAVVPFNSVTSELALRHKIMDKLSAEGGPSRVKPELLNELGVFRGQAGIYRDAVRTKELFADPHGVTIALAHLGYFYEDALFDEWLIYHYPVTGRSGKFDASEVEATKLASRLNLPVFVVTKSEGAQHLRDVQWGEVCSWNDEAQQFKVRLSQEAPVSFSGPTYSEAPLIVERPQTIAELTRRVRDPAFRFDILDCYGTACAFCGLSIAEMLEAAHIIPVSEGGSDNVGNGIPLCASHHRAFDSNLVRIEPDTLKLIPVGHTLESLHARYTSLIVNGDGPSNEALNRRWNDM